MQPQKRTFISVDKLQVAHAVFGADHGVPIVALHGWGASIDLIAPLAARLSMLGYQLYVPDLPGFGETPPPSAAWTVQDYAQYVIHYMDACRLQEAHFFGHSFGGRLCLVIGTQYPERMRKLVLADSAGVPPRRSPASQIRLALYKRLRDGLHHLGARMLADRLREAYTARYGSPDYKSAGALRETFVKVVNEDLLPYAARLRAPTLLIWGAKDEDTPLWQARMLERAIPDAGLVVYEDAGHYSYLDRLPDVVRTLDYFYRTD